MSEPSLEAVAAPGMSQEVRTAQLLAVTRALRDMQAVVFFEKALTSSDAAGSGRVVIPKAVAEQYFPHLEHQAGVQVPAVDTQGRQYSFKYRFWVNNTVSRMYLLEGAGQLHRAYQMAVGDVMMFAQKSDGTLVVAGRPATRADVVKKAPAKRPGHKLEGPGAGGRATWQAGRTAARLGGLQGVIGRRPTIDGVFRIVPHGWVRQVPGVNADPLGAWRVVVSLAGELYYAYFDSQDDAFEAYNASGGTPLVPAPAAATQLV